MQNYKEIPAELFIWITYLAEAVPVRSIPTFIELLIGAMLIQKGFVTEAYLAVDMKRQWFSYYKWLETGKWSWVALGLQMGRLVANVLNLKHIFLIIDDFTIMRASKKAPDVGIQHQHGNKPNRPKYVNGQVNITLSMVLECGWKSYALPLLSRFARKQGNRNKLNAATLLVRVMRKAFSARITLLLDSWYMRGRLILCLFDEDKLNIIGQVRKDTALFEPPVIIPGKKGRPRKYGEKWTPDRVEQKLRQHKVFLHVYGKKQWLHYRSTIARARFLKGMEVLVVWVQFEDENGLRASRLLLCTDTKLTAYQVILQYAKRWSTEPMFNQLLHNWGLQQSWQQTRQVLHRWTQIRLMGYALILLFSVKFGEPLVGLMNLTPWRVNQPATAGRVRLSLQRIFGQVRVRDWWNPKSRKFKPPELLDFEPLSIKAA
jgi:hypothetical protein